MTMAKSMKTIRENYEVASSKISAGRYLLKFEGYEANVTKIEKTNTKGKLVSIWKGSINSNGTLLFTTTAVAKKDVYEKCCNKILEIKNKVSSEDKIVESIKVEAPSETESTESTELSKLDAKDISRKLGKDFVKVKELSEVLTIGFNTQKNVFLYGLGGHAKSAITERFFDLIGKKPFIQSCGDGLTEEKLYGGIDLKRFNETGEIFYNVENSFMNHEFVVFEEMLDAPINVLLSLKDVLSSKHLRQGSQNVKIKTKMVICLTNRSKFEVAEDNSIKALLERFPIEYLVEWDSYEAKDYMQMFKKVFKSKDDFELETLSEILQECNNKGEFISPRTAIHAAEIVKETGDFESIKYVAGFDKEIVGDIIKDLERKIQIMKQSKEIEKFNELLDKTKLVASGSDLTIDQALECAILLQKSITEISELDLHDQLQKDKNEFIEQAVALRKEVLEKA